MKLTPTIIQDSLTRRVLMLGYMNDEAFEKTKKEKVVWFYSRSKQRLWKKGETSGNILEVDEILIDCDSDTYLIKVRPAGPTCHTFDDTCFKETNKPDSITDLFSIIEDRKLTMPKGSYTTSLFEEGLEKIAAKVEEESEEVIRAAKTETKQRLIEESVDVLYHLFVMLVYKGLDLKEISAEILKRRK